MSYQLKYDSRANARELIEMLGVRRPAKTKIESRFVGAFVDTLPGIMQDGFGNRFVRIGDSPVMFSCHTDSVHTQGGTQSIIRDGDFVRLHPGEAQSNCLGGDDAAGVWIMRQMVLRQIPGLYIFHREEEIGGRGSAWIAQNAPDTLAGIQMAIAIDRKGYDSVITHQGSRCASDNWARAMAGALGGAYKPDSGGVFTDTANYVDLVAECSNLSCGYGDAHSPREWQNVVFAVDLLERLCAIDYSALPVSRSPGDRGSYLDYYQESPFFDDDAWLYSDKPIKPSRNNFRQLMEICRDYPDAVADFLESQGYTADDIADAIGMYGFYQ